MSYWDSQPALIWYSHDAAPWYPGLNLCWSWADWTGWQSTHSQWQPDSQCKWFDIANIQGTNEIRGIFHWFGQGYSSVGTDADYHIFLWYHTHLGLNTFYNGEGTEGVLVDNLRAIDFAEFDGSNYDIYFLEALPDTNTGVAELWRFHYTPIYQNISLGEGLLYDPIDITVDSDYVVYILDADSDGDPMVWAWDSAGELIGWTEPLTTTEMSGEPLRIDAHLSADPNEVHVLHSDGVTKFAM